MVEKEGEKKTKKKIFLNSNMAVTLPYFPEEKSAVLNLSAYVNPIAVSASQSPDFLMGGVGF